MGKQDTGSTKGGVSTLVPPRRGWAHGPCWGSLQLEIASEESGRPEGLEGNLVGNLDRGWQDTRARTYELDPDPDPGYATIPHPITFLSALEHGFL